MRTIERRLVFFAVLLLTTSTATKEAFGKQLLEDTVVSCPFVTSSSLFAIQQIVGDFKVTNCEYTEIQPILDPRNRFHFIQSKASQGSLTPINKFLEGIGRPTINGNIQPDEIAAVSFLKIDSKWENLGSAKDITLESGQVVPGVSLGSTRYKSNNGPLFMIPAGSFKVFVTDRIKEVDPSSLFREVTKAISSRRQVDQKQLVEMPMISLEDHTSRSSLSDALLVRESGLPLKVVSATVVSSVRLDETGASAESLETIVLTPLGGDHVESPDVYKIRTNFVVWFEFENLPVFIAHVGTKSMKRPIKDNRF